MNYKIIIIGLLFLIVSISGLASGNGESNCKLPGESHKDNSPSKKKGDQLIKKGADVCTLAKKCDSMEIKVEIKDKSQLHEKEFYKSASDEVKKELDEYATTGHGHDNPNLKCYELEYSVR